MTTRVMRFGIPLIFALIFLPSVHAGERLKPAEQMKLSIQGRDLLFSRDYEGTEQFLKKLVSEWPDEILGYFGLMALYQARNFDNFDFRFDPLYKKWEEKGRALALRTVRDPHADAWDLLVAGATLGISGFYRAHNSHWFSALRDGLTGTHALERSYQRDQTLTDGLLGVGLYNYWRSHFTRKLKVLPFFPDRREQGKETLERVVKEGRLANLLAEISLAFIDYEEKRYPKVLDATERLLKRFPRNTFIRMLRGQTLLAAGRYSEVIKEFETILLIDPTITKSYLFLGLACSKLKEPIKAREYLQKFLDLEPDAPFAWRKPAIERLKGIRFSNPPGSKTGPLQ